MRYDADQVAANLIPLAFDRFVPLVMPPLLQRPIHKQREFRGRGRLGHELCGPQLHGFDGLPHGGVAADHHHPDRRVEPLHPGQRLLPTCTVVSRMNHDHVRFEALDLLVTLVVVGSRRHRQALFDEGLFPIVVVQRTAADDEYEWSVSHRISSRRGDRRREARIDTLRSRPPT